MKTKVRKRLERWREKLTPKTIGAGVQGPYAEWEVKKPSPPSVSEQLIQSLQHIHQKLNYPPDAIACYESEIEQKALRLKLEKDNPALVRDLDSLRDRVKEIRDQGVSDEEARNILGNEGFEAARLYSTVEGDVFDRRLANDSKVIELSKKIRERIANEVAK